MAIKVGLVGAGWWAHDRHAPLHLNNEGTELVGVWARDAGKREAFAEEFGIKAFATYEELLAEVDAVDFAVPPHIQAEMALQAARAGKALILEKPLAGSLEQSKELLAEIEKAGVANIVCFTRRFSSESKRFVTEGKKKVDDGEALTLQGYYVHAGLLGGGPIPESGTWRHEFHGIALDIGPHSMNLAMAVMGPIESVRATSGEVVTITATHANGMKSQIMMSGRVKVASDDFVEKLFSSTGIVEFDEARVDHPECWRNTHAEFLAAVNDGVRPTCTARDAVEVQAVIEAIIASHESGNEELVAKI